ncbi:MAG TPA: tRNA (adenosine(37)-N6)-dimethylallyltransferase MiaA [Lacunisphaera sp.]|nr:tRNA (adenosine(37)-N6)-dimethylallyltransferase MiaA [Lacunisphaera sp.]
MLPVLHVLTGCTAVGKTELALRWAEANNAEIVSCDSLLFYRGMNIGTAKPAPAELERVPHHLIDICAITDQMDVTRYVRLAQEAVAAIAARGRQVLVTGGSGFYLKAFFGPVADDVDVPLELRTELRLQLATHGLEPLVEELQALNPEGLGELDIQNPRRVLRALERCRATGRTLAQLQADFARQPGPFAGHEVRLCELGRGRADLEDRIQRRVAAMLAAGLVREVRTLLKMGLRENPSAAGAIGYRETISFLDGELAEKDLPALIVKNTRALVKKQRTWFKTQLPLHKPVDAGSVDERALFAPKI